MVGLIPSRSISAPERIRRTVALLARRGYAIGPQRLADLCLGGSISPDEVRWTAAASPDLNLVDDVVVDRTSLNRVGEIRSRAAGHGANAATYVQMTRRFVRTLVEVAPFIRGVSIAGSLATGGFREADDVDLNLIVDDGHRHLAYVAVNTLGLAHALAHRNKPVDDLTRRPLAPRLMTANLILERSQCFPLVPALLEHFPQLAAKRAPLLLDTPVRRLPAALFPRFLDGAARMLGEAAWRYMQWTRRDSPDALARVAYVRATMRPYTLFDGPG